MKRIGPSLIALAMLGLPGTTHAGDQVPFVARGDASGTKDPPVDGQQTFHFDISLQATHLGRSTGTATYVLNLTNLTFTGDFDLTGSNGTRVFFHVSAGQLTPVPGQPQPPCLFDFTQTVEVTGGTGAFTNATGDLTGTGQFDYCNVLATATFKGTISRPHSQG